MPLDDAGNFLVLVCFISALVILMGTIAYLIEDILPKHKRKIQDYIRDNVRWFR